MALKRLKVLTKWKDIMPTEEQAVPASCTVFYYIIFFGAVLPEGKEIRGIRNWSSALSLEMLWIY